MKNNLKNQNIARICGKTENFLLYFIIFLVPLFFLPFTFDPLDFNKQFFLGILVFFSLILWLLKSFFSGKFELNQNFLNFPVLALISANLLSLVFSSWRNTSFWGWPQNVSQGFLTVLYFFTIYFLISNSFEKKKIFKIISILIISSLLVSIFSILQTFGKFIFPWSFTKSISFNTIGSLNSLGLFLAILFPLEVLLAINFKGIIKRVCSAAVVFSLFLFFLINSQSIWIVLTLANSILFIFGLLRFKKTGRASLAFLSLIFLIIFLSFLAFSHPVKFIENIIGISLPKILPQIQFPVEVFLGQRAEIKIALDSFKNIKNLFLGTGPATFVLNYLRYEPVDINKTPFWNARFQAGSSEMLDNLVATGIIGILPILLIFLLSIINVGKNLKIIFRKFKGDMDDILIDEKEEYPEEEMTSDRDWLISLGIFSSFIALIVSYFLYPFNLSLYFLFWVILGIFALLDSKVKKKTISSASLIPPVSLAAVLIIGIVLSLTLIKNYQAEAKYLSGLRYLSEGKTEESIKDLKKSAELNPGLDSYWREISQIYLLELNNIFQDQGLQQEEKNSKIQALAGESINAAKKATEVSPKNSINWTNRGFVHKNLIDQFLWDNNWISETLDFYQKAIQLEPANPQIFTEIGQIYIKKSDILRQQKGEEKEINENIAKAKENIQKALELKPDFILANFQMAVALQREGKIKETIEQFEKTKTISPFDQTLAYEIGIFYYGLEMTDLAKIEFEKAIGLDQNYSNARYYLGLIYNKEGNKEKAIEQFEKIESLNPEDQEIKAILKALREGKLD